MARTRARIASASAAGTLDRLQQRERDLARDARRILLAAERDARAPVAAARRVEGEINDHPVNLAPTRAPVVEGAFLWAGRTLLDRLGVEPGEALEVRLRPAPADRVDLPDDLAAALRASGAGPAWEALSPGRRRGLLHGVDAARTPPTRARRIAALLAGLGPERPE